MNCHVTAPRLAVTVSPTYAVEGDLKRSSAGIPIGYEVFDGNTNDARTVQEMVRSAECKHGRARRIWVMDRGMVSEENLAFIRGRGGHYIVGTPKRPLRQFERHLAEQTWQEVRPGVQVASPPRESLNPGSICLQTGRMKSVGRYTRLEGSES